MDRYRTGGEGGKAMERRAERERGRGRKGKKSRPTVISKSRRLCDEQTYRQTDTIKTKRKKRIKANIKLTNCSQNIMHFRLNFLLVFYLELE